MMKSFYHVSLSTMFDVSKIQNFIKLLIIPQAYLSLRFPAPILGRGVAS